MRALRRSSGSGASLTSVSFSIMRRGHSRARSPAGRRPTVTRTHVHTHPFGVSNHRHSRLTGTMLAP